jgi:hypothetical protein
MRITDIIDFAKVVEGFIVSHRFEIQILLLISLIGLLCYLIRKRRSKTLSVLVERKFEEYKGKLRRRITLSEQLSSLKFVITAFVMPVAVLLGAGFLSLIICKVKNDTEDIKHFLSTLHTCGAIVASFTVLLITIIIFTVTINSAYVVRASSLFKFYLRRLYFKPVLSFAAGTAGACLINSILINHIDTWPLWTVTIMVCFGYVIIGLDLVVLFTSVRVLVRSAISEFLAENYVTNHRNSLLAHVKRTLAQNMFVESMRELGFLWNLFEWYKETERVEYIVKGEGRFVNDVFFGCLQQLTRRWKLRAIEKDKQQRYGTNGDNPPSIRIWPGEKLPEKEEHYTAMYVKDKGLDIDAQRIFAKAFVCRKKDRWSVPPVEWSEISYLLKTLIEEKDTGGVESVLESFRSIAADYLESRRQINWPHTVQTLDEGLMSTYRAPTLRNLDFLNFIRFVIRNEDEECLDEISGFLYRMAGTAFEFESEQYFDEVLVRLNWLYELSRGSERLAERTAENVVRYYKYVGRIFDGHMYKDEDNPDLYNHVFPFVQKYLTNILNGMKQAAKFGDKETFQKLLDNANSLMKHHIPDDICEQYLYNYEQKDPVLLEARLKIRDVIMLSNLVISAWLYRGVKESEYNKETIKPFIEKAFERIINFNTLIETYLFAKRMSRDESGLGYDLWDVTEGVYEGDAMSRWIQPFWVIAALRQAASKQKIDVKRIRLLSKVRDSDCKALYSQIDSVLKSQEHKWLTGEEDLSKGKEYLLGIYGALAQRQRKADYKEIVEGKIDDRALKAFRERVIEAYISKTRLRNLLKEYQNPEKEKSGSSTKKLGKLQRYVDKEYLIGEGRDTGLARIYGENIGGRESCYYAGVMEDNLVEKGTVVNFGELPARIKNEAVRLQQKGFNPKVVLIPWDHRYEQMLTDVPKRKRKCPLEVDVLPRWITTFDGMEVFVWPHMDSKSVGIVDIGAFAKFKENEDGKGSPLKISFRNLKEDELNGFLLGEVRRRERREFKRWLRAFKYEMNKVAEMNRIVVIEDKNRLELFDPNAGVKLLPQEKTMGIVYREGEKIYHLPECEISREIPANERRYFANLGIAKIEKLNNGFQSCDSCHPHRERQ